MLRELLSLHWYTMTIADMLVACGLGLSCTSGASRRRRPSSLLLLRQTRLHICKARTSSQKKRRVSPMNGMVPRPCVVHSCAPTTERPSIQYYMLHSWATLRFSSFGQAARRSYSRHKNNGIGLIVLDNWALIVPILLPIMPSSIASRSRKMISCLL